MVKDKYYVIDAHCHVYPEKIASRAVAGTDNFYGVTSYGDGTVPDMLKSGREAGIDHFIVQSVATTPKQVNSINEFIAATVAENKGLLTGLGTLHPDSPDQVADVRRVVELGLKGVKLHPDIQNFKIDDYRCLKIYELCEQENLPILMHTGDYRYDNSNPNRLLPVLQIYSGLTIIGAHFGGWSIWEEASQKLGGVPNLYVDCSSTMGFTDLATTRRALENYGADRVLFGTDYPMWGPADELEKFFALGLSEEDNRKILSENAKKLFSL
ncbi:MAG: amidohydrolase [Clostridia bacterium]|nr:amidohydrolase [Clostridia bacterium]